MLGGSIGRGAADKRYRLCQLALQERVPLVMMLEGAGHRVTDAASAAVPATLWVSPSFPGPYPWCVSSSVPPPGTGR